MTGSAISPKERARRVVEAMPDDASVEDVIERLVVAHKVERGMEQARSGEGMLSQDDVEAHFARRRAERD